MIILSTFGTTCSLFVLDLNRTARLTNLRLILLFGKCFFHPLLGNNLRRLLSGLGILRWFLSMRLYCQFVKFILCLYSPLLSRVHIFVSSITPLLGLLKTIFLLNNLLFSRCIIDFCVFVCPCLLSSLLHTFLCSFARTFRFMFLLFQSFFIQLWVFDIALLL